MILLSLVLIILVLSVVAILGLVVWLQSPSKPANIIFAWLSVAFIAWSATSYFDQTANGSDPLLPFMAVIPFIGASFITFFITLFSLEFPESYPNSQAAKRRVTTMLALTTPPVLGLLLFTKLIVAGVSSSVSAGNNIVLGPLYGLFPLYFLAWMVIAFSNLLRKFRRTHDGVERLQLSYVFLGLFLTLVVGFTTNVVIPLVTNNAIAARFGFLATLFTIGFFAYAIAAHRLFNIRQVVARSVAYLLLLATLTGLYGVGIFATSQSLFPGGHITTEEMTVFTILAIILAVTYQPLRRFYERITDSVFFHDRYDAQVLLDNISSSLVSELLLEPMINECLKGICRPMRLATGHFLVIDQGKLYRQSHYGTKPAKILTVEAAKAFNKPILVADELRPGKIKELLAAHNIRIVLTLESQGEIVGYLFLGHKLSGDTYSSQDIKVLNILRKELTISITNARAYEEISHFNQTLQKRIHEATDRLSTANHNLKTLDKAKDDFIAMASHQLGTPLTAITGYLSMALDDDNHNMTSSQIDYIHVALEASERMVGMSSDLLNVSRLSSGRFNIQRQAVDLAHLIEEEVQQLMPSAERKSLELIYLPPSSGISSILVDESKTRQVIMNFIDNAIYYTQTGSIRVELTQTPKETVLKVVDSGIGVPPGEQSKLFAKFYRAENAKSVRPDGTGLGLYLAKRVIEEQGGTIIFESVVDKGSTFGFRLPSIK